MHFTIYTAPNNCPGCIAAKQLLSAQGHSFEEIAVTGADVIAELDRRVGASVRTVPQVFLGEQYIGGLAELKQFLIV